MAGGEKEVKAIPTAEVCRITAISRQRLYYLEQKAVVHPRHERVGEKEFRYYSNGEIELIKIIRDLLDQGYRYRAAIEKALSHEKA